MDFDKLPEWLVEAGMEGRHDKISARGSCWCHAPQQSPAPRSNLRPIHSSPDIELTAQKEVMAPITSSDIILQPPPPGIERPKKTQESSSITSDLPSGWEAIDDGKVVYADTA